MTTKPARPSVRDLAADAGYDLDAIERLHGADAATMVRLRVAKKLPLSKIGARLGISKQAVSVRLMRLRDTPEMRRGRPLKPPRWQARFREAACAPGATLRALAVRFDVCEATITNYIRRSEREGVRLRAVSLVAETEEGDRWEVGVPFLLHPKAMALAGVTEWPDLSMGRNLLFPIADRTARALARQCTPDAPLPDAPLLDAPLPDAPFRWLAVRRVRTS